MIRQQTAAEAGRQKIRGRDGRYDELPRCYGGCGRGVNVQGDYSSHPLTDCNDAEGQSFSDIALLLCKQCGKAAQKPELQTVRAWKEYVARNAARH